MGSKKWVFTAGAVGLIAAGLAVGGYFVNASFEKSFAKAVKVLGAGATGRAVTVGDIDLNVFTGTGSFSNFKVTSGSKDPDIFILDSVAIKFSPWSLLFNDIKVEALTVGKIAVNATITGSSMNLLVVAAAANAFARKPTVDYGETKITLDTLEVEPGAINVTFKIPGRSIHKSLPLPGYKSVMARQPASNPVKLVTGFVTEFADRAARIAGRG